MDALRYAAAAVAAYLLGSFNFSIIVSRIFTKQDIRTQGSGNAGATNSLRVMGKKLTVLVLLGDMAKGVLAVFLGRLFMGEIGAIAAGAGVILGHIFPVYFKFKGGKGILTGLAVFLMLDWRCSLCALALFILLVLITRFVSLGSMAAAVSQPVFAVLFGRTDAAYLSLLIAYACLVLILHTKNISRLIHGTENKLGEKKK